MVTINRVVRSYNNGVKMVHDVEYKGLSTDTKPTDCATNSLFLELDTGKAFYFDGEDWNEIGA